MRERPLWLREISIIFSNKLLIYPMKEYVVLKFKLDMDYHYLYCVYIYMCVLTCDCMYHMGLWSSGCKINKLVKLVKLYDCKPRSLAISWDFEWYTSFSVTEHTFWKYCRLWRYAGIASHVTRCYRGVNISNDNDCPLLRISRVSLTNTRNPNGHQHTCMPATQDARGFQRADPEVTTTPHIYCLKKPIPNSDVNNANTLSQIKTKCLTN